MMVSGHAAPWEGQEGRRHHHLGVENGCGLAGRFRRPAARRSRAIGRTVPLGRTDARIGIPNSRSEIVMLRPPDGGAGLELSSFVRPDHDPGAPAAMSTELGLRNVAFEVDDLQAAVEQLAADGYGLVGGVGQYEHVWRMAYVRGPEGIIVSLAERIG
jgi:catechol 2,3-dioxygenase-like lactoylglutathione lyase family enzyme